MNALISRSRSPDPAALAVLLAGTRPKRSLTKRGIAGVYHAVSSKHRQGYLNEYAWRYNRRHEQWRSQFSSLLLRVVRL